MIVEDSWAPELLDASITLIIFVAADKSDT